MPEHKSQVLGRGLSTAKESALTFKTQKRQIPLGILGGKGRAAGHRPQRIDNEEQKSQSTDHMK